MGNEEIIDDKLMISLFITNKITPFWIKINGDKIRYSKFKRDSRFKSPRVLNQRMSERFKKFTA